jgi:PiT family inorganic phosphate transporter
MTQIIILIALALIFGYLNGFSDSSNIVATMISSRAMSPRVALGLIAVTETISPFIFGVAVAHSIGQGIVAPQAISPAVVLATLASAILWSLFTWFFGIPSSASHALVGGFIGAVASGPGIESIMPAGIARVLIALFAAPFLGLLAGFLVTRLTYFLARHATPRINVVLRRAQFLTGISLGLSYGANDSQKAMGMISLALVATHVTEQFEVPLWVIGISALAIALGTTTGSWRLIRTLGARFYKIRPVNGFCSQLATATIVLGTGLLGGPVSTTQVISSAILGVGSAERINKVRWGVAQNIGLAWLLTIPSTALLSALIYALVTYLRLI